MMKALIFDCDGVLVDTERDGHRVAFNSAFTASAAAIRLFPRQSSAGAFALQCAIKVMT